MSRRYWQPSNWILADRFISAIARRRDRFAERGDRQDAAAAAQNFAIFPPRPGVENDDIFHLRAFLEAGDFLARVDVARVAGRGHDDGDRGAIVELEFQFVESPVDRGFEQREEIALSTAAG